MDSVCRKCFHAYVCEEFNADRDYPHKRCAYANDHFVYADRLGELAAADREGRVVVIPCKAGDLLSKLEKLQNSAEDAAETYATGYRNGHRNGQAELIRYIFGIGDGSVSEAEAALKEQEKQK